MQSSATLQKQYTTSAPRSVGDPHRAVTLRHQYRFLPALAHAKALEGWRSGAFQWLVLVDDDAIVYPERLTRVLGRYDPTHPLYLGDFGHWTATLTRVPENRRNLLSWEPPYSCGGSGTIFSHAAVAQIDFARCAHHYHQSCYQSDWMIGRCSSEAKVTPVVLGPSCGTCLSCGSKQQLARQLLLSQMEATVDGCAFATLTCEGRIVPHVRQALCRAVEKRAAIVHGWNNSCDETKIDPNVVPFGSIALLPKALSNASAPGPSQPRARPPTRAARRESFASEPWWVGTPTVGHCGATETGDCHEPIEGSICALSGSWNLRRHGIDSLAACIARCRKCSCCSFVSFSSVARDVCRLHCS